VIFEWDESKRCENLRKHGLDFRDCAEVFRGHALASLDERFDYGEHRFRLMGRARECVVIVVYLDFDEVIRIVSMRKANRYEQAVYFKSLEN
jgi:uncharacterized DUF497 family protein